MPNTLILLFSENPVLLTGLDLLVKSTVLLLFTFAVSRLLRIESFRAKSHHLLLLIGLFCLALIPLIDIVPVLFDIETKSQTAFLTLPALIDSVERSQTTLFPSFSSNSLLVLIYLAPCLLLLSRMVFAVRSVIGIGSRALVSTNRKALETAIEVAKKLEVSRSVSILQSREITSPFSFGIFSPKIVLPVQANDWSESMLEDVLVHEFTHIKRLDWPTTLICHFIASLYWINPLCWMAINKISEEAENSCDTAVLDFGKNYAEYAKNLMSIARQSRDGNRLLTQMMADNNMLSKRVQRILKGKTISRENNAILPLLTSALFTLLVLLGNVQIIALESSLLIPSDSTQSLTSSPSFVATPRFGTF